MASAQERYKVLFVCNNSIPHGYGGVELYSDGLARALSSLGIEVHLLYPRFGSVAGTINEIKDPPLTRFELMIQPSNDREKVWNKKIMMPLAALLERENYNRIHFQHFKNITPTLLEITRRLNIPVDLTVHDAWTLCERIWLIDKNAKLCSGPESIDKCLDCLSPHLGQNPSPEQIAQLAAYLTMRKTIFKKCFYQFNRVDFLTNLQRQTYEQLNYRHPNAHVRTPGLAPLASKVKPLHEVTLPLKLVCLSRVAEMKGQHVLVQALKQHPKFEVQVDFYGAEQPSPFLDYVKQLSSHDPRICFHGAYTPDDLPKIFEKSHALIFPSFVENYPLTVREALQARRPVLASAVGGIPEIASTYKGVTLIPPGDPSALAHALKKWVDNSQLILNLANEIIEPKSLTSDAQELIEQWKKDPLPHPSIWQLNIMALESHDPETANWVKTLKDWDKREPYLVTETNASIQNLSLHDPYNPQAQAEVLATQWLSQILPGQNVSVIGFGLGYHLEALLRKMSQDQILEIQLMDRVLFQMVLEKRDLKHVLSDRRLKFVSHLNFQNAFSLPSYGQMASHKTRQTF